MKIIALATLSLAGVVSIGSFGRAEDPANARRPNVVFFIADDMQRYMFNCLAEGQRPYHLSAGNG